MNKSKKNCALLILICYVLFNVECSYFGLPENATVADLEPTISKDMFTIISSQNFQDEIEPYIQQATMVRFWLFTRQNRINPIVLNSIDVLNTTKPIKILIHGWGGNADVDYIDIIKDAYLETYDCNVISVDYSVYAVNPYVIAYSYVQAVGKAIAEFVCSLSSKVCPEVLHIVGHSLGAQVAGIAGDQTKQKCQKTVGRITGLDPAGPLFQNIIKSSRLDSQDAALVDVIHTNQGQYGYVGNCGTVDFYPNCGYQQPNCFGDTLGNITDIDDLVKLPISLVICSHQRSCNLFAESIKSNSFHAKSCFSCGLPICLPKAENVISKTSTDVYMGESCRSAPEEQEYLVYTNGEPPYAQGPEGPANRFALFK